MIHTLRWTRLLAGLIPLVSVSVTLAADDRDRDATLSEMRSFIEHETLDHTAVERRYRVPASDAAVRRLEQFYTDEQKALDAIDFPSLDQAGRIDYLLMRARLRFDLTELARQRKQLQEVADLLPFASDVASLAEARQRGQRPEAEQCAQALTRIEAASARARRDLEAKLKSGRGSAGLPSEVLANRAAEYVDRLRNALREWNTFYSGYDPVFTWWTREAYPRAEKGLKDYGDFLRRKLAGYAEGDDNSAESPVIGDPIGRDALLEALAVEMIPYTPEELIDIAQREWDWCQGEMKRASEDLGCGGDWKAALAKVAAQHVQPGEQPKLIRDLAEEATRYVEDRGLVTIPPLCKESWRMMMMTPERQRVNPYFTGGETISVSYPTEEMPFADKVMSLKGNNIPFCRATVFHELIPGHHLQLFMAERYNAHRRAFTTPFLIEGWALYWEMRMWDLGFPRTPEERVGMLFWRCFRCQRVICSLKFHLGQMTAKQWIDVLVDQVGHERRNATAEVRRSVNGAYGPLYQAAYLLGGLQLRALHKELIDGEAKMPEKQFHDAVLRENSIPIELIRASLTKQELTKDYKPAWRF